VVVCIDPRGIQSTRYGPWVDTRAGETSKAACSTNPGSGGVEVYRVGVETDTPSVALSRGTAVR
jgi:hypothetical protein